MRLKTKARVWIEEIEISAGEWGLFTATYPEQAEKAAQRMSLLFKSAVNANLPADHVRTLMLDYMRKYDRLGALDSEPLRCLDGLLDQVYPEGATILPDNGVSPAS